MPTTTAEVINERKTLNYQDAWRAVLTQLRTEVSRVIFETWIYPLKPQRYENGLLVVGAYNNYAREWVDNRLKNRIAQLYGEAVGEKVSVSLVVLSNTMAQQSQPKDSEAQLAIKTKPESMQPEQTGKESGTISSRKAVLQRAYGSERAKLIQPERGMFVTLYLLYEWLPLIGNSAFAVILASRSLCFWNPATGELRNVIETDMSELAQRASVSLRTVKDVLSQELIKTYFLRYRVRRMMTPNGVRTAGISLQVRMDDPLTPRDQELSGHSESTRWFSSEFDDTDEEV